MQATRVCNECGKPLAADGDCPICALKRALALSGQGAEAQVVEQAGDRIGRYKLLEKIGEGGYGVVYMAEQAEPIRRRVALKIVKLGMDTRQVIARFEAERQALALMDHPNIAKVLDAGATDTGRPYFVMELVRGIRITDYCDQHHLAIKERLDLFMQVCQAVQHAHQKGIIHRDLKPSNVLVTELDGVAVPKVIDFGIAKATSQQLLTDKTLFTAFQQFIGTPAYMSPEQAGMSGADVDTRSDIYSLGVLLYELLTGQVPFEKKELLEAGLDEMRRLIREKEPIKPSTRLSALSAEDLTAVAKRQRTEPPRLLHLVRGDLDWIVMKCLEKDRARRYETANSLAHDVARHLNDEPVTARPPGALYRFQKMVRRNKLAFVAATAVALTLSLGIIGSTWQAWRARTAEREKTRLYLDAEQARQKAQSEAQRAEQAATEVKVALSAADFKEALRLIAQDNRSRALAYLARSLKLNRTNDAALTRLTTLLTYHSWPLTPTLVKKYRGWVQAEYSPDGNRIAIVSSNVVQVWDAHIGLPVTETIRHEKGVLSAQFSPDGNQIVTASADDTARVWDARTGRPLGEPMKHRSGVHSAQFSPNGKWIVTVCHDGSVRVWDAQTGRPFTQPMEHSGDVSAVQFSPDSTRLVTAGTNSARLWEVQTGRPLGEPMKHEKPVNSTQFSPDGKQIVTACANGTARVWDAQTSQPLTAPMKDGDYMHSAQFSPDGKHIITVGSYRGRVWDAQTGQPLVEPGQGYGWKLAQLSLDGNQIVAASDDDCTAQVWDAQTGRALAKPLCHDGVVTSVGFSPDGEWVITASDDRTARVWDAASGEAVSGWMWHEDKVRSAKFGPDGQSILTISGGDYSEEYSVRIWNVQSRAALAEPIKHKYPVDSAKFSPDGKRIVTASGDSAWVWDAQTGQQLARMAHGSGVPMAELSPDGKWIITVTSNSAQVWDAHSGLPVAEPMKHEQEVRFAQFSPDGDRIVTASGGSAWVWNALSGQQLTKMVHGSEATIITADFSPDGKLIVTELGDSAWVWDAWSGRRLAEPMKHDSSILSAFLSAFHLPPSPLVCFSPDGTRVMTLGQDTAQVWDAQTGRLLSQFKDDAAWAFSAQFSPDGRQVLTASISMRGAVQVWDARSGQRLTESIRQRHGFLSARFSPDAKRILTVTADNGAQVLDPQSGLVLSEPMRHGSKFLSARFSPDGKRVVTAAHDDSTALVWDVAPSGKSCPGWLPTLAEAVGGERLNRQGLLEGTGQEAAEVLDGIRQRLEQESTNDDWVVWGRWFLGDVATRTISPFSMVTMSQYSRRQANEDPVEEEDKLEKAGWLLATSPVAELRDGQVAMAVAKRAAEETRWKNPLILDTLAAAYAEAGQFSLASSAEQQALKMLKNGQDRKDYYCRLKLYCADTPYRDTSTNGLAAAAEAQNDRVGFLEKRGRLAVRFGLWKQGVRDLSEAVRLDPGIHRNWYTLAHLLLEVGDVDNYREHCRKMLARFGATNDPEIASMTARACLLGPLSKEDLALASQLAETAVTVGKNHSDLKDFQLAKGLAEYRTGSCERAVEWTKKALKQSATYYYQDVQAYALLAMAQHRLNRPDEARAALIEAAKIAEEKLPTPGSGELGSSWITAQTLLQEARGVIEGGGAPSGKQ